MQFSDVFRLYSAVSRLNNYISGISKDGSGPLQTSLTDLKPPAAPHNPKRHSDLHSKCSNSFKLTKTNTYKIKCYEKITLINSFLQVQFMIEMEYKMKEKSRTMG